ncbi:restriction endonuclease subunit S [Staphylococcus simulans]|uniref:restriction endonuclease subunit S n=1 Tax=Staphylococcus simulans TaxID=1286 RepID=UPI000CD275FA|nr:restriction endonuclease subunit S [Staphylococcus simulans]PNZ42878.1 restriction endonuclease subunit S [Staphylococcus simulans]SQE72972.1 type I restriction modification DNA specificity protein [Staphylococcus simulans]
MSKQNQHKPNVPELRFPEFSGEWEEFTLGEKTSLLKDGTHGTHKDVTCGPWLLSAKNIKNNKVYIDESDRKISIEDYNRIYKNYSLEVNDILLSIVGTIGRLALVKNNKNIAFQRSVAIIRMNDEIKSDFLIFLMQAKKFQNELKKKQVVSAQPGIYLGDLAKIKINYPNIEEQQKISDFFSKLDRQIELEEEKLALLEEQKKGYMQKIFSQELRFKDENGNEYPEWEEKRLGEIAEVTMGQSPKSKNYTNDSNYMVLVQGNADLKDGKVYPRLFTKEKTKITNTNDILLTVRAPVGEIGISQLPVVIGRGVCSIKSSKFIYFYLEYLKEVNWWSRISQGSTFESISGKEIRELVVRLPIDANEQYKIITIFNKINDKISDLKRKIELIRERKKTLLRKVFI